MVSPIEGTPAHRAGLLTGDRIVKIDGLVTKDMQLPDAVKRMRGKPGTKVTITVVREGWTEPKDFDITREQIRVQSVRSADLGGGIAYVKLRRIDAKKMHCRHVAKFGSDDNRVAVDTARDFERLPIESLPVVSRVSKGAAVVENA